MNDENPWKCKRKLPTGGFENYDNYRIKDDHGYGRECTVNTKTYYIQRPATGEFIAIKHGAVNYYSPTVFDQTHADTLNEAQGINQPMASAAFVCCFNGCWGKFHYWVNLIANLPLNKVA